MLAVRHYLKKSVTVKVFWGTVFGSLRCVKKTLTRLFPAQNVPKTTDVFLKTTRRSHVILTLFMWKKKMYSSIFKGVFA